MLEKPGQVLTSFIKNAIEASALTNAQIAEVTSIEESRLKALLNEGADMTVDEFVLLSQSLEITVEDLGLSLPVDDTPTQRPLEDGESPGEAVMDAVEPAGNQPAQVMQLGFGLGCDIFFVVDSERILECGLPESVLQRFPEQLPIRLNAAYHRHIAPSFLEAGLRLTLSFDALYTCTIPWDAFVQVTLFPQPFEPTPKATTPRGHLRLVD